MASTVNAPPPVEPKTVAPHHGGQGQVRPDGEVDAPGQDDQELSDGQDRDDGGLGEHVAEVLGRREHRREVREHQHQDAEDQHRPEAQQEQQGADHPQLELPRELLLMLRHGHLLHCG